jgi:hypothetical protein
MTAEMEINSGLNGFIMLDGITSVTESHIAGTRYFSDAPVCLGLESLAQLGALHIRRLIDFSRHVFLLKIVNCSLPAGHGLNGEYTLTGKIINRSDAAYLIRLRSEREGEKVIEGDFLFAAIDYDTNFKKETLRHHYRKLCSCLQNDLKTGC